MKKTCVFITRKQQIHAITTIVISYPNLIGHLILFCLFYFFCCIKVALLLLLFIMVADLILTQTQQFVVRTINIATMVIIILQLLLLWLHIIIYFISFYYVIVIDLLVTGNYHASYWIHTKFNWIWCFIIILAFYNACEWVSIVGRCTDKYSTYGIIYCNICIIVLDVCSWKL